MDPQEQHTHTHTFTTTTHTFTVPLLPGSGQMDGSRVTSAMWWWTPVSTGDGEHQLALVSALTCCLCLREASVENLQVKSLVLAARTGETGVCRGLVTLVYIGGSLGCSCDASSCFCFLLLLCCLKEIFYWWWKLFKLIVSHLSLRIRFCIFLFRIFIDITHYMLVYRHIFKWHENFLWSSNPWLSCSRNW